MAEARNTVIFGRINILFELCVCIVHTNTRTNRHIIQDQKESEKHTHLYQRERSAAKRTQQSIIYEIRSSERLPPSHYNLNI
jgi:hypothetical protein